MKQAKKLSTIFLLTILSTWGTSLFSQQVDRNEIDPHWTERWEPVPPKVDPGERHQPPSDAIILFDGTDLSEWESARGGEAQWVVQDGAMTVKPGTGDIMTKRAFGDMQLHIEWRTPSEVSGESQGRGNSGVFLMNTYEVQVLDSYNNKTYSNGQAGSIYKQHIPLVNASRGPGEWQTYDIIFMAPIFKEDGTIRTPATVTVLHNGVLVQNHVAIRGTTHFKGLQWYEAHEGKLPIKLQDHSNPVSFRNIWIREL